MTDKRTFKRIAEEMSQELERILDFWSTQTLDTKNGGFLGQIDHFGVVNDKADKGAVLNARILWTFSAAYRHLKQEPLLLIANRAYAYLLEYFIDKDNGGVYWALNEQGEVLNSRKQAYAQGFALYAFSEYYLASGNVESLEKAKEMYALIEEYFLDKDKGGYIEALDKTWLTLEDMRLSEKDANLPKSMNTHLHILEPYTNLYRAWPNRKLKESIILLLELFQTKIIDSKTGHFGLFFEMDWTSKSKIVSYGHDIEGAWLLHEAAIEIGEKDRIKRIQKPAKRLVDVTIEEGTDEDGSVFYEEDNGHLDTDKHWWPQAEAMVGLMDAWEISREEKYLVEMDRIWCFIKKQILDHENGEWFGRVDKDGKPITSEDKAGFWKCPYHNSRALIEMINRINKHLI